MRAVPIVRYDVDIAEMPNIIPITVNVLEWNIFDKETMQVELQLGCARIQSHLVTFNKKINYKDILEEAILYDVYELKFHGLCLKIKDPKLFGEDE